MRATDPLLNNNLSAIISDWNTPGMFNKKTARECTREEIAEEAWKQIKAHVNKPGERPVLTDDMLHTWYLDPGILNPGTPEVANEDPLFIQILGAYETRPTAGTGIENFFLAGDWVRTGLSHPRPTLGRARIRRRQEARPGPLPRRPTPHPRRRKLTPPRTPALAASRAERAASAGFAMPEQFTCFGKEAVNVCVETVTPGRTRLIKGGNNDQHTA